MSTPSAIADFKVQPAAEPRTRSRYFPGGSPYVLNVPDASIWPGGIDVPKPKPEPPTLDPSARSARIGTRRSAAASGRSPLPSNSTRPLSLAPRCSVTITSLRSEFATAIGTSAYHVGSSGIGSGPSIPGPAFEIITDVPTWICVVAPGERGGTGRCGTRNARIEYWPVGTARKVNSPAGPAIVAAVSLSVSAWSDVGTIRKARLAAGASAPTIIPETRTTRAG